jgi:radical SAM protein with 4Fe4S-binding SPASM domain
MARNKVLEELGIIYEKIKKLLLQDKIDIYRYYKVPPIIQIEPTTYCNLNCICCPVPQMSRKRGYMDFNLFKKIIDDAAQIGVKQVDLFLHGEPLLHPCFVEMVTYIKTKKLRVVITTNGTLFEKEKTEELLHSGLNSNDLVLFSILGYSKEVHEMVQKGVNHEKVVNNIRYMLELRKKLNLDGPKIEVVFYATPENEHEKNQYEEFWRGVVDGVNVYRASQSFREVKKQEVKIPPRNKSCWLLWKRMCIFWNGEVTSCTSDVNGEYLLGDLKKQSIREIWNSEKMLSLKKLHKNRKFQQIPLCSHCDW